MGTCQVSQVHALWTWCWRSLSRSQSRYQMNIKKKKKKKTGEFMLYSDTKYSCTSLYSTLVVPIWRVLPSTHTSGWGGVHRGFLLCLQCAVSHASVTPGQSRHARSVTRRAQSLTLRHKHLDVHEHHVLTSSYSE
jgi:hypothetical protein